MASYQTNECDYEPSPRRCDWDTSYYDDIQDFKCTTNYHSLTW